MTPEEKRVDLREKVEASRQRLGAVKERMSSKKLVAGSDADNAASGAVEAAAGFIQKYPIAVTGGAIVVGIILGSRGKKTAVKAAGNPKKRHNAAVSLLIDAAISYGVKMLSKPR